MELVSYGTYFMCSQLKTWRRYESVALYGDNSMQWESALVEVKQIDQ
jgi:hypothetical protein